ncbi:MAG TPA: serine/threonine-protein kinase, partial [Pirellulales bacterium]|nr:serine/threonine-protein kinase [Pirellulales bacterium]
MSNMSNENNPPSPAGTAGRPLNPQSVEGIFVEALAKEPGQPRAEFVEAACRVSAELRARVEALLRAYDDAGSSFLRQPAGDWRSPPVTATADAKPAEVDNHGLPRGLLQPSDNPESLGNLGPYQVREVIGRGGMGIVLRAFDAKLNRVVAIKVLGPELAAQPTARRRFLREAQAAAAVTHPHVVTIHAVDEDEWPYLVMECVEGPSLQEKIQRSGTLKLPEVLRIGTQIAEGLASAHKQGLIHRDVKPANSLLENGVER